MTHERADLMAIRLIVRTELEEAARRMLPQIEAVLCEEYHELEQRED
jgi:hypothetical protein